MGNTEAMREALEAAQEFIKDVHYAKWLGHYNRRNQVQAKIAKGFAAIAQDEQRQEVPAGWKLVPVEPTKAMITAAHRLPDVMQIGDEWRAMLNAAPRPK